MKLSRKIIVVILVLLGMGIAKMPIERGLTKDLRAKGLLDEQLDTKTREKIGQTSAVVALGGLRTVVAAMMNLRTHLHFEEQQWYELKDTAQLVTTLQPRNSYYWESGGWHMSHNASVDFLNREDLPEARRRILWRQFINDGSDFLEQGLRLNPDNWRLQIQLAKLWSDPYRIIDLPRAVTYLKGIKEAEGVPPYYPRQYFYMLARIPGREREAYEEGRLLFEASERNRLPTLTSLLFVLQNKLNMPENERLSFKQLFESNEAGYSILSSFQERIEEYPQDGVAEKVENLKSLLGL